MDDRIAKPARQSEQRQEGERRKPRGAGRAMDLAPGDFNLRVCEAQAHHVMLAWPVGVLDHRFQAGLTTAQAE
jgi:hypothetical protein